jgi:RluA family pseudouridine synthase
MKLKVQSGGAGARLDVYLAAVLPGATRALVMKYLKEGAARLNGRRARAGLALQEGDEIDLPDVEASLERIRGGRAADQPRVEPRPPPKVQVLYEDDVMLVVDKPPGLVMHSGSGHEHEGLDLVLREGFGAATRLVHRIDRDTSGVVVAARGHPDSARRLTEAFREGDAEKVYRALVRGAPAPPQGTIDAPLVDTKRENERVRVDPHGRPARTDYATLEAFRGFAWLEVRPRTGRRHQIRAHLAHVGHPLAVDRIYGGCRRLRLLDLRPDLPRSWKDPVVLSRQPLHAARITLRHPRTGEEMTFEAPLPRDLEAALEILRGTATGP